MKLYGLAFSPFVQRVLLAARFKGHALPLVPPEGGTTRSPAFRAIAPMGRVPLFEADDGWRLAESQAIVAYLDDALDGPRLYPADPRRRAWVRQVEALCDGEVGAGLRHFAIQRLFGAYDDPSRLDYGRAQAAQGLAALERIGTGPGFPADGGAPGAADAVLIPILVFARLFEHRHDGPAIPAPLAAYLDAALAQPAARAVHDEMMAIIPWLETRSAG